MELYSIIIEIFGKVTDGIVSGFYVSAKSVFSNVLFTAVAVLLISIFFFQKIASGEPVEHKDIYKGAIFVLMYITIRVIVYDEDNYYSVLEALQYPRNVLSYIVMGLIGETKPENVLQSLNVALNSTQISINNMVGSLLNMNFTAGILSIFFFLLSLILMGALCGIVILSTLIARILAALFVIMIFFIFIKPVRGYFFSWLKLYISYSLYAPFGVLIGIVAMEFGKFGASVSVQMNQTQSLDISNLSAVIIGMILCIFLLIKIPNIINAILGTSNDSTTGGSGIIGFMGGVAGGIASQVKGIASGQAQGFGKKALDTLSGGKKALDSLKGKKGSLDDDSTHH